MDSAYAIDRLISEGLALINEKYGPGSGFYLPYHNATHAEEVMDATRLIAAEAAIQDKIPTNYVPLLVLAACYHDSVHERTDGQNEAESARLVADKMRETRAFPEEAITVVTDAILATRFRLEDDHIRQAINADYTTQIVADADLASAGRPFEIFWARSQKLREEQGNTQSDGDFIRSQLNYLRNHSFHTEEAADHFPHQADNVARLQAMLEDAG